MADLVAALTATTHVMNVVKALRDFDASMNVAENGGTIETDSDEWFLYPIFDSSDKKRIARTCNDVLQENSSMKEWPNWPENAFAIANNSCGDALVFLIRNGRTEDMSGNMRPGT